VALEEMDVLFGGVNHVEKGGDQLGIKDPHHADANDMHKLDYVAAEVEDSGKKV
jgi:hypothetical protein